MISEVFDIKNDSGRMSSQATVTDVHITTNEAYAATTTFILNHHEAERMALAILSALNAIRKNTA